MWFIGVCLNPVSGWIDPSGGRPSGNGQGIDGLACY